MKFNILNSTYISNNENIATYHNEIFTLIREKISSFLNQGKTLQFDEIFKQATFALGIEEYCASESKIYAEWFENLTSFLKLTKYLNDVSIHEIIIHDYNLIQVISSQNSITVKEEFIALNDYDLALEILAFSNKETWNYQQPFCSFWLDIYSNSFRATLIHHSTASNKKSKLFLRRINKMIFALDDFDIPLDIKTFLTGLIENKNNFVISGSTCSGKTSLLSSLLTKINKDEHLVILEDTNEIQTTHPTTSYFLANEKIEGKTLKDYCAYTMRMRPDRILLGEMRSNEIVPFILSMNTGHRGLISTIHANSAKDCISRMCLLFSLYSNISKLNFATITSLICQNVEYIVHMENKKIKEIIKIFGADNLNPIYDYIFNLE
ncbi:MAG: hypothetical protein A2381_02690 [Bdellovibrionales bacterium RIFOXYB1_FULL_37_110]|nr:MAG: hypothetical protein A2181_05070 [Bdellovibrionales bacterium RIFOXYA1_FULL_38_20]OFZ52605.1 MAG: hypothetical protein A2417_01025 [Bdellovibrionales bacterium RIFOXYC1_FULL_37_79]OFZ58295.1 MAG: hypothetical protein A2381_02690 [Bdellovibrionales bacterium RIFOXYB1_FULL_37_110]OFZ65286.1 MAG: hypothetical protein A2577_04025 [Bdellovibrionales bacterium RIFOXYD1_FULL_36_51]